MLQVENEFEITTSFKKRLEVHMARNELLQKENQELKEEVSRLKSQIISLKAHNMERKTILWKKIQKSIDDNNSDSHHQLKPALQAIMCEKSSENQDFQDSSSSPRKEKSSIVLPPTPPPKPASTLFSLSHKNEKGIKMQPIAAPPPPPTPSKSSIGLKTVRRVPEVIELYRSLTRKDANMENKTHHNGIPAVAFTRNMIEEIENRSKHLSAVIGSFHKRFWRVRGNKMKITTDSLYKSNPLTYGHVIRCFHKLSEIISQIKSEVQSQKEFISFLIKQVESASYADISEVETFIKWLDGELSSLVDERSVLKHFPQWPEQKVDALREASCNYRELKNLESEVSSYEDNPKEPISMALKRIQALQDRLEGSVSSKERIRESSSKKYRNFHIPWEWMMDTGLIGQIKLCSLRLAKEFMKRIIKEMKFHETLHEDNNLLLQGVKFAFRVHQFAGGFDPDTTQTFLELKKVGCAVPSNSNLIINPLKHVKVCQKHVS